MQNWNSKTNKHRPIVYLSNRAFLRHGNEACAKALFFLFAFREFKNVLQQLILTGFLVFTSLHIHQLGKWL